MRNKLWAAGNLFVVVAALVWRRMLTRTTVTAITGSTGKTTAKECLAAILSRRSPVLSTIGNAAGRRGLPRTLLRARRSHRFVVAEVAILKRGIMWRSAALLRPDIVVMLVVNWQHSINFRNPDAIAAEKAKLLDRLPRDGRAVLNRDDARVAAMARPEKFRVSTFGTTPAADVWADDVSGGWPERLEFRVHAGGESQRVRTKLVGTRWVTSVVAAIAAARQCGVSLEEAAGALEDKEPFTARLEPVRLPSGAKLLRDEYNGSMTTLLVGLDIL